MLQEQVVPRLDDSAGGSAPARVWVEGDVDDAVAVTVAYGTGGHRGRRRALHTFATSGAEEPPSVSYSMSDIRSVPPSARRAGFRRSDRGWIPSASVAERVFLGLPPEPVDLIVLRNPDNAVNWSRPYSSFLRPGGHVLVVGRVPATLTRDSGLEQVRGTDFLRRKESGTAPGTGPAGTAGRDGQVEVRSLAHKILEEELVGRHLNLARGLARRFSGHGEPVDDLRQVAFVGLVLAARRYDPSQNASFSTYATATILGELKRYFRDKSWMMRVPRHVQETYLAIKTAREELYQELACSPTIDQIARRLGISEEAVLEAIEAGDNFLPQSLDTGPDEDSPGREVPVIDPSFDVMLERNLLMEAIPRLSHREQLVLKRVYLDGWTQRKVAQEIGVSQMQVSRLLQASAQKIRTWTGS